MSIALKDKLFKESKKKDYKADSVKRKVILEDICCHFPAGKMTAVMGPSGAGKTTLLKAVAGDSVRGIKMFSSKPEIEEEKIKKVEEADDGVESDVSSITSAKQAKKKGGQLKPFLLNGKAATPQDIKDVSSMVYQDDVILPTMTVKEAIMFAARLRNPQALTANQNDLLESRVSHLMHVLGLTKVADTEIGEPAKGGISGGERKRTSIAMQLVTNPPILFLDEPTSGLDAGMAMTLVKHLEQLTKEQGISVIATIHQPSSQVFHLFDWLVILSGEGKVVYEGPVAQVVPYFAALGYECPQYDNPADYLFLEVLSDPSRQQSLRHSWLEKNESVVKEIRQIVGTAKEGFSGAFTPLPGKLERHKASFWQQFKLLARRAGRNLVRDKMILRFKFVRSIFFALMISAIYRRPALGEGEQPYEAYGLIQDRISTLYFLLTNETFSNLGGALNVFQKERPVFLREYKQGLYDVDAYYLAKILVELPAQCFFPVLTSTIPYFVIGLRSGWKHYVTAMSTIVMMSNLSAAIGLLLGSAFAKMEMALAVMPMIMLPFMIFGGVLVNLKNIPKIFTPFRYMSPIKHAFVVLTKNDLTDYVFGDCTPPSMCTGNSALKQFSIDEEPEIWVELAILGISLLFLYICAYLALYRVSRVN